MVVGSSGFLGGMVAYLLAQVVTIVPTHCSHRYFPSSISYDFFRDDIRDVLDQFNVNTVIFCATVEREPTTDVQASMERFVRGCKERRMIYLSSDGVFDGSRGMYTEEEIPAPCTLYGCNLFMCEQLVATHCPNFCIIRPSYIYGFSNGQLDKRLAHTCKSLKVGEEVTLFNDMYKSPLGVQQVAEAVINLSFSDYNGIVHAAGERLSVFDFHYQAMETLGVNTRFLRHCSMPSDGEFMRDTSLSSSLWQELTGMEPMTVSQTLLHQIAA